MLAIQILTTVALITLYSPCTYGQNDVRAIPIIEKDYLNASKDLASLEQFVQMHPLYVMTKDWQKGVEDRFVDLVLSSDFNKRFVITDFINVAKKSIPDSKKGSVTIFGTGSPGVVGFHLEYPKDKQPFSAGGAYLPMGHKSIWRFKGIVKDIMGINFQGDENNPLRFVLVDGYGLVYLYGKGTVLLKNGTSIILP